MDKLTGDLKDLKQYVAANLGGVTAGKIDQALTQIAELTARNEALEAHIGMFRLFLCRLQDMNEAELLYDAGDEIAHVLKSKPVASLAEVKAKVARDLAGVFHDGGYRNTRASMICEEYAAKLRSGEIK